MLTNFVQKSFDKASKSYHSASHIQKDMALNLDKKLDLLVKNSKFNTKFLDVLELGSGTGNLTYHLIKKHYIKSLFINDLSKSMLDECKLNIKKAFFDKDLNNLKTAFVQGDFTYLVFDRKFDVVISNAMLQWCSDLPSTFNKFKSFLKPQGIMLLSTFGPNNFMEFKDSLNITLNYAKKDYIKDTLESLGFNVIIEDHCFKEYFDSVEDLLSYLKSTGVSCIKDKPLTISKLKAFIKYYDTHYKDDLGVYVTWHPLFIKASLQ